MATSQSDRSIVTQPIMATSQSDHSIDDRSLSRFAKPKTENELQYAKENAEPITTKNSNKWALSIWNEWSKNRIANYGEGPGVLPHLLPNKEALDQWMSKFILEIRRLDGEEYPPNTIYQITCGIMRNIRKFCPEINFFKDVEFHSFRTILDSEMKRLKASGLGIVKRVEPISFNEEEKLWSNNVLGSTSPQVLLNTVIYMCGVYFALRSGKEHRDLQFDQIRIEATPSGKRCIKYTENASKNNPGGLKHRKIEPKTVVHFENSSDPDRCFIRLVEQYISHCPTTENRKSKAFYLTPLKKPKNDIWYSPVPVGHNTLANTMKRLCKEAGLEGYKTNHSLRVTAATRLYNAGVDEQLIMQRTGHRSIEGVRIYKRTSEQQQEDVSSLLESKPSSNAKRFKKTQDNDDGSLLPESITLSNCSHISITINK